MEICFVCLFKFKAFIIQYIYHIEAILIYCIGRIVSIQYISYIFFLKSLKMYFIKTAETL